MKWNKEGNTYYLYCHAYNQSEENICELIEDMSDKYHFKYYLEESMVDFEDFWECGLESAKRFCELAFKVYLEDKIKEYENILEDIY